MRLSHLEVWHWRGLDHVTLADLAPGTNLVVGDNGAGKTRLFQALRAAFFEGHRGMAEHKRRFQSLGSSDSPEVEVRFERGGTSYTLRKRFLKGSSARLDGNGESHEGEAAEARLRELMGSDAASTKGARDEQMGLWPLVWVPQHASHLSPSDHLTVAARRRLEDVLGAEAGQVGAGVVGDRILARAEEERLKHWTRSKGQATGELGRAEEELVAAEEALAEVTSRREDTRQRAAALARCEERLAVVDEEMSASKGELAKARAALAEAERFVAELDGAKQQVQLKQLELQGATSSATARAQAAEALDVAVKAHDACAAEVRAAKGREAEAAAAVAEAESAAKAAAADLAAAKKTRKGAEDRARRAELQQRLDGDAASLEVVEGQALELDAVRARLARLVVDDRRLEELQTIDSSARQAEAALEAAAARVEIRATGATTLDGEPLEQGQSRELVVERATTFRIGDVAEVRVEPGGEELGARRDQADDARAALRQALDEAGVASLAEARLALEDRRRAEGEVTRLEAAVEARAPEGIEGLRTLVSEVRAKIEALGDTTEEEGPELSEAEALAEAKSKARDEASLRRTEAQGQLTEERVKASALSQKLLGLGETMAGLQGQLDRAPAEEELVAAVDRAREALAEAERARDLLAAKATEGSLEDARATRERLERSLEGRRREQGDLRQQGAALRGALESRDERGLHDLVQDGEARVELARQEVARLRRWADAARLLHDTLVSSRQRTRQVIWSGVQERIGPYLTRVLPGHDLRIDDGWNVEGVGGDPSGPLPFAELSGGIREQVALIVRCALAEALAGEAGLPLVLDDPLVNTDPGRLQTMLDILDLAKRHLQIVVLSCDEGAYRAFGEERKYRLDGAGQVTVI